MPDPIKIISWKWSDSRWPTVYGSAQVNTMAAMLRKHVTVPYKFCCITDNSSGIDLDIEIIPMWNDLADMGHCYRRLKAFSKEAETLIGKRFMSIDLDSVILGNIDSFVSAPEDFVIVRDTQPPTPYNGSMFLLTAGSRAQVWEQFDPVESPRRGRDLRYCACDQAWIGACLGTHERVWTGADGVKSFRNEVILKQSSSPLPTDKIVFFHGSKKPWDGVVQNNFSWIKEHYQDPRKRLVILGGAGCVYDDLKRYSPPPDAKVMVINDMGAEYPGRIDYWVSLHPDKLGIWQRQRRDRKFNQDYLSVAHRKHSLAKVDHVFSDWGGSSGLFATKSALMLGFDHVVLCGIPMDSQPNVFRKNEKSWSSFQQYKDKWPAHIPEMIGKVFSMSGWTREQLNP